MKFVAALLLALWLPATLHCALEAADLKNPFLTHAESHHDGHPADEVMHPLDQLAYKAETPSLIISPPIAALVIQMLVVPPPVELSGAKRLPSVAEPPGLIPSWSFARRAALPARAPDFAA